MRIVLAIFLVMFSTSFVVAQVNVPVANDNQQLPTNEVEDSSNRTSVLGVFVSERGVLNLSNQKADDFSELAGLKDVRDLILDGSSITDLSPLPTMKNVEMISLSGTNVTDLTPLTKVKSLKHLYMNGTPVTDLTPMSKMTWIEDIGADDTLIEDLSPLKNLKNCAGSAFRALWSLT